MKEKSLEDQLFILGLVLLIVTTVFLLIFYQILLPRVDFPPCFCDKYLGFYCPGCGGTRAMTLLLHGYVLKSLWYHPLVVYTVCIFGAFMLSQATARLTGYRYFKGLRFHNWYLYGALAVVMINFIVKNCLRFFWDITL